MFLTAQLTGCHDPAPAPSPAGGPRPSRSPTTSIRPQAPAQPSIPVVAPKLEVQPRFVDVALGSGIDFTFDSDAVPERYFLPEVMGGGAGWLDYDLDGYLDLYLANGCRLKDPDPDQTEHTAKLFRASAGQSFSDATATARVGHIGYGQGIAVADFDADGFDDLFLGCYGSDVLYRNNGDGTFSDVTRPAGIDVPEWTSGAAWFDADGNGDLDLYVVTYMDVTWATHKACEYHGQPGYCGPGSFAALPDRVYLSTGDGRFVERSQELGLLAADGKGLAVSVLDLDDDLVPEVYVANDMEANFLFRRKLSPGAAGPAKYEEVAVQSGCATSDTGQPEASMGIAVADFDNDLQTDLYLTHFLHTKNTLYRNLGKLLFVDDSRRTRSAATSNPFNGFGTSSLDYDRDGWQDLIVANGHVLGPHYDPWALTPLLLRNDGAGRVDDISRHAGPYFQKKWLGRSLAPADYDNDGDLDFAITHLDQPVALLRNDTETSRHFIGFQLRSQARVPPVGGRIVVTAGRHAQVLPIVAGGSYLAAGDPRRLFGVGEAESVRAEIHWPSGRVDTFDSLSTDRYWEIWEGKPPNPVYSSGRRVGPASASYR